jgi:hypothetical protein
VENWEAAFKERTLNATNEYLKNTAERLKTERANAMQGYGINEAGFNSLV